MNNVAEIAEKIMTNIGISNINKCCVWLFGQPEMDVSLQKYRKETDKSRKPIHKLVK